MTQNPPDNQGKKMPDRPLECYECKKPIAVVYTEIVGETMINTSHCIDCPILQRKLHGSHKLIKEGVEAEGAIKGLCCGNCGTTLEAVQMGTPLGCTECYEVFADILVSEMLAANKISQRISPTKSSIPLHIGRAPGESTEITPTLRLLALNEALNETLSREDYEQAAWLRDQIKALTEKPPEKKGKKHGG
jgi:protein arginine kinase activator